MTILKEINDYKQEFVKRKAKDQPIEELRSSLKIDKAKNFVKSENFIILNGDAIFDANLNQIFNFHEKNKKDVSFICCEAEADFGTVGVINNKVINFERSLNFKSVNTNINDFKAYVYSGMCIFKQKVLKE